MYEVSQCKHIQICLEVMCEAGALWLKVKSPFSSPLKYFQWFFFKYRLIIIIQITRKYQPESSLNSVKWKGIFHTPNIIINIILHYKLFFSWCPQVAVLYRVKQKCKVLCDSRSHAEKLVGITIIPSHNGPDWSPKFCLHVTLLSL